MLPGLDGAHNGRRAVLPGVAERGAWWRAASGPQYVTDCVVSLFERTVALRTVSSEASVKSLQRAPGTVTSTFAVAPGPRFGKSQLVSSARAAPNRMEPLCGSAGW
jgi:hypothetical protein